jgi:hypothetical protein
VRQTLWQTTRLRKEGPRTEGSKSQFCLIRCQKQIGGGAMLLPSF